MNRFWQTSKRKLDYGSKILVMGILNVTPDSFSDGGRYSYLDSALFRAEEMIAEGVDIIDIGGESTRPMSLRITPEIELERVVPVIEAISNHFDTPISIDTSKSIVAKTSIDSGAEIINDISGLRFDDDMAVVAAETKSGLVLMHLRGNFETMHAQPAASDILSDVTRGFLESIKKAKEFGVSEKAIALDIGIGFSKALEQNLELIAKLDKLVKDFSEYPILTGTSRKSFLGKILGNSRADERLIGSVSSAAIAIANGASIVRVHDIKETVETAKVAFAIRNSKSEMI